jgi:hypothetical protein
MFELITFFLGGPKYYYQQRIGGQSHLACPRHETPHSHVPRYETPYPNIHILRMCAVDMCVVLINAKANCRIRVFRKFKENYLAKSLAGALVELSAKRNVIQSTMTGPYLQSTIGNLPAPGSCNLQFSSSPVSMEWVRRFLPGPSRLRRRCLSKRWVGGSACGHDRFPRASRRAAAP